MTTPIVHSAPRRARPRDRRRALVALALLLVAGAGVAATLPAPLAAQDGRARSRDGRHGRDARDRGRDDGPMRLDTTVAVDARALVEVALNSGTVIVRSWDRSEVRLRADKQDGRLGFEATRTRISVDDHHGGDTRVEITMPRGARLDLEGATLEVDIAGVRGGVAVENASGDVQLADVGGVVQAEVMSGELTVRGGDGDFRLQLASGDVVVENVAGRIEVENVSGDIMVRRSRARELRLETTSGTVTYEGTVQADGRYELSSHSGDVTMRLPEGTRARLEADTYNGEFRSDFPVTMQPTTARSGGTRQRRYELLVGDGAGPLIRVSSFTGDITLVRMSARPDSTR